MRCRVEYIQSECNTATAMTVCENYILEGDHCANALTQCRNMTFEHDKGLLSNDYNTYWNEYSESIIISNDDKRNTNIYHVWVFLPIYLFIL